MCAVLSCLHVTETMVEWNCSFAVTVAAVVTMNKMPFSSKLNKSVSTALKFARLTDKAFDDFAGGDADAEKNRRILGL